MAGLSLRCAPPVVGEASSQRKPLSWGTSNLRCRLRRRSQQLSRTLAWTITKRSKTARSTVQTTAFQIRKSLPNFWCASWMHAWQHMLGHSALHYVRCLPSGTGR